MLKKEKRQNLVNSTVSCVQSAPDVSLSYLRLTARPQAVVYGWRQGAVHGADPGSQEGEEEEEEEGLQEERGRSFQPTFGLYHEP